MTRCRIILVLGLAAIAVSCDTTRVTIAGQSMSPTLKDGEHVVVTKTVGALERGDIVAFRYPRDQSKNFVQRIIGLPGERLAVVNGRVVIDDKPISEDYVAQANRSSETSPPVAIPAGEYFVMGDNRGNSSDSRTWGTVPAALIWGRIVVRP